MKFFSLINVKMATLVGILTCMSGKNNILGLTEPKRGCGNVKCIKNVVALVFILYELFPLDAFSCCFVSTP